MTPLAAEVRRSLPLTSIAGAEIDRAFPVVELVVRLLVLVVGTLRGRGVVDAGDGVATVGLGGVGGVAVRGSDGPPGEAVGRFAAAALLAPVGAGPA